MTPTLAFLPCPHLGQVFAIGHSHNHRARKKGLQKEIFWQRPMDRGGHFSGAFDVVSLPTTSGLPSLADARSTQSTRSIDM